MKSKDLLVGKGGPDGSSSSPKAMLFKDLLVGKGGPWKSNPEVAPVVPEQCIPVICRLAKVASDRNRKDVRNNEV